MFEQRISLVTLGVADVQRARRFYEALGWTASEESGPEIAFFHMETMMIALYRQADLSRSTGLSDPRPGGVTLAYNARSREEVDERLVEALAAGARILSEPQDMDWGGTVAYFADPDGHAWEIAYAPMFVPDETGRIR